MLAQLVTEFPETGIMFALAAFVMAVLFLYRGNFFSPAPLYFLVQVMMLGIAYTKLYPAMTDFHLNTWLVWIGGGLCFLLGCAATNCVWRQLGGTIAYVAPKPMQWYNWKLHFLLSFSAFAFFLIGVIGVISVAGNLVLLTKNPSTWLDGQNSPVLKFSFFFTSSPMVVALFALSSFKSINPVKWIRTASKLMVLLTICLSFMTFPSRGVNMICVGLIIILANYLYKRLSWKHMGVIFVFILAFFVIVAYLKGQYGGTDLAEDGVEAVMDKQTMRTIGLLPYKYISNNFWNLDYAFNISSDKDEHPWTYGIDAFFGFTQLMRIGVGLQESFGWDSPFNERVAKVGGLNTIPYLWDAYKDFGYPGIFLLPFFFGVLFTCVYRRMMETHSPLLYLLHAVFSLWIILWNFTTGYKQGMYWVWMGFFFMICSCSGGRFRKLPADSSVANEVAVENEGDNQITSKGGQRDDAAGEQEGNHQTADNIG